MTNAKFQLGISPVKLTDIPPEETILKVGRDIMDSSKSWKQGKSFIHNTVKTYWRPKGVTESAGWHCRMSEHSQEEATFDEFWAKLGENKAENEKNYVPDIKKVALVKDISPTQSIWTLYYTFPPPISPRVFTVLQTMHLDQNSPRTGAPTSPATAPAPAPTAAAQAAPKTEPIPAAKSTPVAQPVANATSHSAAASPAATAVLAVPGLAPMPGPTAAHAEADVAHAEPTTSAEAHGDAVGNEGAAAAPTGGADGGADE
ncbi:hypothetical protein EUX98_g3834 [Antrodiella citrinella]|uniref:DUF3074 domain-containing protein n=1 Tax=Antrodiella citrinella TaxID=2447956 RepID=A0A4S4MVJ7_9APHY|nr:hypothetical protein EUX98_g3834 [Antrodiella citrinella]